MVITVNKLNGVQRIVYLVALLLFAVALTTALVLAGERNDQGQPTSSLQTNTVALPHVAYLLGNANV